MSSHAHHPSSDRNVCTADASATKWQRCADAAKARRAGGARSGAAAGNWEGGGGYSEMSCACLFGGSLLRPLGTSLAALILIAPAAIAITATIAALLAVTAIAAAAVL